MTNFGFRDDFGIYANGKKVAIKFSESDNTFVYVLDKAYVTGVTISEGEPTFVPLISGKYIKERPRGLVRVSLDLVCMPTHVKTISKKGDIDIKFKKTVNELLTQAYKEIVKNGTM